MDLRPQRLSAFSQRRLDANRKALVDAWSRRTSKQPLNVRVVYAHSERGGGGDDDEHDVYDVLNAGQSLSDTILSDVGAASGRTRSIGPDHFTITIPQTYYRRRFPHALPFEVDASLVRRVVASLLVAAFFVLAARSI